MGSGLSKLTPAEMKAQAQKLGYNEEVLEWIKIGREVFDQLGGGKFGEEVAAPGAELTRDLLASLKRADDVEFFNLVEQRGAGVHDIYPDPAEGDGSNSCVELVRLPMKFMDIYNQLDLLVYLLGPSNPSGKGTDPNFRRQPKHLRLP